LKPLVAVLRTGEGIGMPKVVVFDQTGPADVLRVAELPQQEPWENEVACALTRSGLTGELWRAPRSWVERTYTNLIYFNEVDKGGHFAAWEQPELFASEVRAAFRSLR
jgi:hypothetical protein